MNKSDSERIASVLENIGYDPASNENEADLIVVNMCSVRQSAVDRIFGLAKKFSELKMKNEKLKIVLTGCILKEDKKKFLKNFDFLLNIRNLPDWPKILSSYYITWPWQSYVVENYLKIKPKYRNDFSALVPISNGCNMLCAYCVVPFVRGKLICRNYKEIIIEVKNLIKKRFREIWLLGQNVNDYKSKVKSQKSKFMNFAKLLKMMNDIPGEFWDRFTSPHPSNFSDELIETMAKCQKITPYLNLPVQSGDNEILKRMNRPYTVKQYKNLVKKIKAVFKKYRKELEKEVAISTDVIVGFPGETKKQFENTVKLFREIKFDMAYIAKYSPRPQTAAFLLKDNIASKEKERRYKILSDVLKKIALEKNKKYIGKEVEVLIDSKKDNFYLGKTRTYKTVKLQITNYKLQTNLIGQFIKVKIINASPWGLKGSFV